MSMKGWYALLVAGLAIFALLAWTFSRMSPDRGAAPETAAGTETTGAAVLDTDAPEVSLFYGTPDGQALVALRRELPLRGDIVERGHQILQAQLEEPPPAPYVRVIPEGTTVRAFYVTAEGDAFVDLSQEIVNGHPGGSLHELLTVYALVNAVTANLPAARRVQILVEGQEVDTIAGHVDLRRPMAEDPSLVRED